jgi:threonine synthase
VVPNYLKGDPYQIKPSVPTISNAMDVGDPSNFARMHFLYDGNDQLLRSAITGCSYDDEQTREEIRRVNQKSGYVMCPHTSVGYRAARECSDQPGKPVVTLGTAHPVKFREIVEPVIKTKISIPETLQNTLQKEGEIISLDNNFDDFRAFLMQ